QFSLKCENRSACESERDHTLKDVQVAEVFLISCGFFPFHSFSPSFVERKCACSFASSTSSQILPSLNFFSKKKHQSLALPRCVFPFPLWYWQWCLLLLPTLSTETCAPLYLSLFFPPHFFFALFSRPCSKSEVYCASTLLCAVFFLQTKCQHLSVQIVCACTIEVRGCFLPLTQHHSTSLSVCSPPAPLFFCLRGDDNAHSTRASPAIPLAVFFSFHFLFRFAFSTLLFFFAFFFICVIFFFLGRANKRELAPNVSRSEKSDSVERVET
ncbi:transmembrane protein, putative, partial [Bodo saltans]